ncbi:MAG: hypothetical protein WBD20_13055 [Pirellulaceae bacterium]
MRNTITQRQDARLSKARRSLRQTILASTLSVAATLAIAPASATAADGFFEIQNPLRSSSVNLDAVTTPTHVATAPVATKSYDETPRRMMQLNVAPVQSGSTVADSESSRSLTRGTLAIDAIGMEDTEIAADATTASAVLSANATTLVTSPSSQTSIEQSAKIQPLTGHFVFGDRGWLFVPADQQITLLQTETVKSNIKPYNGFRDAVSVDKLRHATQNFVELFPPNRLRGQQTVRTDAAMTNDARDKTVDVENYFRQPASPQQQVVATTIELQAAVVAEDLMLQRVLQTVRNDDLIRFTANDTSDNTLPWKVTGTISNVNGQARLTLHTAQPIRR